MSDERERLPRGRAGVVALGFLTITAYGSWFYSFGVLIDPITQDVGWSTTALGAAFGAAQVISGIGALVGGRLLDRHGAIVPFVIQAVAGGGLLLAATWAESPIVFGGLYAVGAGIVGATGFYHLTTAVAARLRPDRPDRSIADLTLIGALASPLFLPLAAWMASTWHWRTVARVLALLAVLGAVVAAITVGARGRSERDSIAIKPLAALRDAVRRRPVRRMLTAYVAASFAMSAVLVYQVPILTAGGVSLAAAGTLGGLRGFCQIFGRVGLGAAVERFGSGRLLAGSYAVGGLGVAFLFVAGVPTGLAFALLAGVGFGASAPLQAIYARGHFEAADLGLLMALQGATIGLAGGLGPFVGGALRDTTDSWAPVLGLTVVLLAFATWLIAHPPRTTNGAPDLGTPRLVLRGWGSNPRPTD